MKKTNITPSEDVITVTMPELKNRLCLGRVSCEKIAKEAGAIIKIGGRTVYNIEKIRAYINLISE